MSRLAHGRPSYRCRRFAKRRSVGEYCASIRLDPFCQPRKAQLPGNRAAGPQPGPRFEYTCVINDAAAAAIPMPFRRTTRRNSPRHRRIGERYRAQGCPRPLPFAHYRRLLTQRSADDQPAIATRPRPRRTGVTASGIDVFDLSAGSGAYCPVDVINAAHISQVISRLFSRFRVRPIIASAAQRIFRGGFDSRQPHPERGTLSSAFQFTVEWTSTATSTLTSRPTITLQTP